MSRSEVVAHRWTGREVVSLASSYAKKGVLVGHQTDRNACVRMMWISIKTGLEWQNLFRRLHKTLAPMMLVVDLEKRKQSISRSWRRSTAQVFVRLEGP